MLFTEYVLYSMYWLVYVIPGGPATQSMNESYDYRRILTIEALAYRLNCSSEYLKGLSSNVKDNLPYLNQFSIKKKSHGYRFICEPVPEYGSILKTLANDLNNQITFPDYITGYIRGRSIVTNATFHLAKKYVQNIDIENFFQTIQSASVENALKVHLGLTDKIASIITRLTTVDGVLQEGLHTSPFLSNLVFLDIDRKIIELVRGKGITYSRYADDLTFSSDSVIEILADVSKILNESGFKLNADKTILQTGGKKQIVTGLSVSDSRAPHIPKYYKKGIKNELYILKKTLQLKDGLLSDSRMAEARLFSVKRRVDYINAVDKKQAKLLYKTCDEIRELIVKNGR